MGNKAKKLNIAQCGFIQIPILLIVLFGALVGTIGGGGYYVIEHKLQSTKQNDAENGKTATTSAEGLKLSDVSGIKWDDNQVQKKIDFKPLTPSKPSVAVLNEKKSEENNKAEEEWTTFVKNEQTEQLRADIKDFSVLLKNVQDDKELWIMLAESHAGTRFQSLDTLGTNTSFPDIKQFVINTAGQYRQDKENTRAVYTQLYKPLEEAIDFQLGKTRVMNDEVWQKTPTDELQQRTRTLLLENKNQMDNLLAVAMKVNTMAREREDMKSDYYKQDLGNIDTLLSSYSVAISVSQKLLEIEQQARARTLPKTEIYCWATTQHTGGIVNGTSQTSIRCE